MLPSQHWAQSWAAVVNEVGRWLLRRHHEGLPQIFQSLLIVKRCAGKVNTGHVLCTGHATWFRDGAGKVTAKLEPEG